MNNEKFRETCKKIIEQKGACSGLVCSNCPGSDEYNNGVSCIKNGWSPPVNSNVPDEISANSAKKWLEENPEIKKGDWVYVSDVSIEDAMERRTERIYLVNVGGKSPYVCITDTTESLYPDGGYVTTIWKYVVPIPKEEVKEITIDQLEKEYGCKVKIVGEKE